MTARTVELLKGARALIANGWTQRRMAENAARAPRLASAIDACHFCMVGALSRAADDAGIDSGDLLTARGFLEARVPGHIVDWNDDPERTQDEVIEVFDEAIAAAEVTP